jgi:hypothetical protein
MNLIIVILISTLGIFLILFLLMRQRKNKLLYFNGTLDELRNQTGFDGEPVYGYSNLESGRIVIDKGAIDQQCRSDLLQKGCIGFIGVREQPGFLTGWYRDMRSGGSWQHRPCTRGCMVTTGIPVKLKQT